MTRMLLSLGAAALLATSFGCASNCNQCGNNGCPGGLLVQEGLISGHGRHGGQCGPHGHCDPNGYGGPDGYCGHGGHGGHGGHFGHGGRGGFGGGLGNGGGGFGDGGAFGAYQGGPPTATVAYPYYTTRGPRDFLSANPRGIGP